MRQRLLGDDDVTSCLQTRGLLQRYLDGETGADLAERIARHLRACRACGLEAEAYQAIKEAIARSGALPPPPAVDRLTAFAQSLAQET
jgi:anti-sigma factor RsiW